MKTNLKDASRDLKNWLNNSEKATGLPKSVLITGALINYALKASKQEENSKSKVSTGRSKKRAKKGNI